MSTILLVDDDSNILANTAKKLEDAGYKYDYVNDYKTALNFLRLSRPTIQIVVVTLNNSLGYPVMRKLHSLMADRATIIVYSNNKDRSIANWVKKHNIPYFFEHHQQEEQLFNHIKRSLYRQGQFFSHQQLSMLATILAKYTNDAESLVKQTAPHSKSLQELQHKLARKLDGIDNQRRFLSEVQK
ncbi:response regulator [Kangiella sediminilitoris]|uniref:Response regulator receiver protein n=1 Tax=Kangiella sediminilitoris TaxID=1144748 RepID=A0A1B3BCW0_9GAMM|nr:response regulator [Kangiella sediminilitoris]AOE50664.1 Response regulator receiver protein [Kangiella sediminilitoris]